MTVELSNDTVHITMKRDWLDNAILAMGCGLMSYCTMIQLVLLTNVLWWLMIFHVRISEKWRGDLSLSVWLEGHNKANVWGLYVEYW